MAGAQDIPGPSTNQPNSMGNTQGTMGGRQGLDIRGLDTRGLDTQDDMAHPKNAPGKAVSDQRSQDAKGGMNTNKARGRYENPKSAHKEQVRAVQQALNDNGARLQLDGQMGQQTRQALRNYQRDNQLPQTGKVDKATLSKLNIDTTQTSNAR